MVEKDRPQDNQTRAHDRVYRRMRARIMHGEVKPGQVLTLRGVAREFDVSMTPAREALRRLTAEGAVMMSSTGRLSTPILRVERIEELAAIRTLLEPELAIRAQPRVHLALIERLENINRTVAQMVAQNNAVGYVQSNLEFHRTIYLRAQAPAMLAMAETAWLQLGPTMAALYSGKQRPEAASSHLEVISALRRGEETALRNAISRDVTQGLKMLTTEWTGFAQTLP